MSSSIQNAHFLYRKLHSLFGVIPVGGFLAFHLWENSQSRFGAEYYNEHVVRAIQSMNYVHWLEVFVIALPLLFHAIYGLVIWWYGKTNVLQYGYTRNWLWWLQRISGIGILLFLIFHVGWTRILSLTDPSVGEDMFGHMSAMLHNPLWLATYLLGLALACFHLSNGLWTFSIAWGITTDVAAYARMRWLTTAVGLLLFAFGMHSLVGFLQ